ncbi:NUF1 protein [Scheffersomyces xylosifermentans]|uniref:NUF1 protein n=1 Tax=Scheffersomyces xylosifermentans TaxID=1304137 RepID=UPI00315D4511
MEETTTQKDSVPSSSVINELHSDSAVASTPSTDVIHQESSTLKDEGEINTSSGIDEKNESRANESKPTPTAKLTQQEIILKRLKDIPLEQLKEIITNQIDLEIRLKHQELRLTEAELSKIESQMILLRKFFEIPNEVKIDGEPNEFTVKYFSILKDSLTSTYSSLKNQPIESIDGYNASAYGLFKPDYLGDRSDPFSGLNNLNCPPPLGSGHSYRTRSTTSSLRPTTTATSPANAAANFTAAKLNNQNLGCLYRRTDGIIVKLTCPDCQRSNFSSAQGFLNHSRIAHAKEYTSQDAAALKCGEIIPEIKQDPEGESSILRLKEKGIDPNKNLNVNEIYFNGLSNSLNTVHNSVPMAVNRKGSTTAQATEGTPSEYDTARSTSIESSTKSNSPELIPPQHIKSPEESELLKKLIKEGKMKKEEYEQLVDDTRKPITNAHLFADEVEEDDEIASTVASAAASTVAQDVRTKLKRRKSRGGINITITRGDSGLEIEDGDEDDEDEDGKEGEKDDGDASKDAKRRRKS